MLKGLGNLAGIGGMIKQAQEMGGKMQLMTEELKAKRVTGSAGAGMVEVEANGEGDVLSVRLDPALIEKQDRELMEDLIPAAVNAARQKAKELHAEMIQEVTGGLNLPGLDLSGLGGDADGPEQSPPAS